jgi:hypothetical protein
MNRYFVYIGVFVALCVSFTVGYKSGSHKVSLNSELGAHQEIVKTTSALLGAHLNILEKLSAGEYSKGAELLERLVDLELATLGAHNQQIPEQDRQQIINTIRLVREYRRQHGSHKVNDAIFESVTKSFDLVK